MKTIKLSILLLALLTFGQAKAQGLSGSGTTQDPYLITSDADWITFAQNVTDGMPYAGQTVKLTADIAASTMAGSHYSESDYQAFSGTFDGDGHAITLALSGSGHGTALFCCIEGGILKNLKVQGSVTTTEYRPATFASFVNGNSTISNCWSTVAVSSSRANDWVDGGGFVGRVSSNAMLNMTDCAFHGSVTFDSTATTGGGMVGYTQSNATVNLTNCLYSPTALTLNVSQYNPRIFVSGEVSGNLTNCYYNAVAAASVLANQGFDTSGMTNEELVAALGPNWTITDGMVVPFSEQQYNISSAAEWNAFATALSNGMSFSGRTVTLTADIPTAEEISNGTTAVTTMAGTNATPFAGIFDGQGHTLTVSIVSNELSIAPFRFADGATFQNLKIDGNIDASSKFAAGMLAETKNHSCSFINCISNVTLTSSVNGDGTHGGFVAYLHKGNTTFEGCAFTGKLLGANTTHSGGFVGFTDSRSNASVTFTNCVFHPQQVTMSGTSSQTFARWYNNNSGSVTIGNNCYYSEAFGNAQGKQIHPITSGDYVTVAFDGNATPYELSGIDAYSVGIVYDSTLYAGNGETVSLNLSCTPPSGYTFIGYTATSGTLTGTANPYTLTMPNEAVTIQAVLGQPPVPYIDENGVEQQCTFYTVVTDTLDFYDLPAGWYVVNNDFTHNGPALIFGDAHLILCDGAMMNISYGGSGNALNTYGSLTLYGQSEGTGSLSATSNNGKGISVTNLMTINGSTVTASGGDSQGIYATNLTINGSTVTATGSNHGISSIDLTINGSTVTASANDDGGMGISANRVTINSGTVNATGNESGIYIGNEYGYVTINGGTVTVTGDYGIYSPTVTLGWSILTDSITVGNFDYNSTPTVSVKSGQAFYYIADSGDKSEINNAIISGTLTAEEIAAIGGKTLRPYIEPCATPFDLEVTDIEATTATLHWIGGARQYQLMYGVSGEKATREVSTGYNHSDVIGGLTPNTTYEWKVRGINSDCDGGHTEWSETATFTTFDACPAPSELSSTATHNQATLSWTGFQESYNVRYRMLERAVGWVVATTNTTTLNLTDLEPETTYVWQVQGINCDDNGTNTDWSEMATFTTLEVCAVPSELQVTDISATTATLQWMGIQDSYNVQYRTAERAGEWFVATTDATTLDITGLVPETLYEWKVQGVDCDGEGNDTEWSEIATFTTLEGINFTVTGYGQGNGGYSLIASPFDETNPLDVTGMLSGNHDLYAFVPNPSDSLEWRNYATDTFNLIAGKGYLYANADTVTLTFNGTPYSGNGEVALVYDATDERKCWNLVGNPFPYAVYLDREYYVLDADGTGIDPEPIPASVPVPPCTAVFVKAVGVNDRAVFSLTAP